MWGFSFASQFDQDQVDQDRVEHRSWELRKPVKAYFFDGLMIKTRIMQQLSKARAKLKKLGESDHKKGARIRSRIRLLICDHNKIEAYIQRVVMLQEVEDHQAYCQEYGIDPRYFIMGGGRILQTAIDDMNTFLSEPDPFQEFDRGYD